MLFQMSFKTSQIVRSTFHGSLSCEMAEARLKASGLENCYLTRESNIRPGKFILSHAFKQGSKYNGVIGFRHIIIPSLKLEYRKFSTRHEFAQAMEILVSGIESCKNPVLPSLFKFDIDNDDNDSDSDMDNDSEEENGKKEKIEYKYGPNNLDERKRGRPNHYELYGENKCYVCGKEINDYMKLKSHRSDMHHIAKCKVCGKLILRNKMFKHQQIYHDKYKVRTFNCNDCDFTTKWNKSLQIHKTAHTNKLYCLQCRKSFEKEDDYLRHKIKHSNEGFKCSYCASTYLEEKTRDRHMRKKHNFVKEAKVYVKPTCPVCGYVNREKRRLQAHLNRYHTVSVIQEKPPTYKFKCDGDQCEYMTRKKSDFVRHTKTCPKLKHHIILF